MEDKQKREMSEGEELIKEFLEEENIKFGQEVEINNLMGDNKSIRKADFYLLKYKVYIEFLGKWNNLEHRREYIKKMNVYKENNIPCIYFYPENLGIIGFLFKRRQDNFR